MLRKKLRHCRIGAKQEGDLATEIGQRPISVDDVVRELPFLAQGYLGSNASQCLGSAEPVPLLEPGNLRLLPRRDHDQSIHPRVGAGFDQHGGVVNDDREGILPADGPSEPGLLPCHSRVNDRPEPFEFPMVAEDDCSQECAIDRPIGLEDVAAERLDNVAPGRLSRLHHLPGQQVGIDDVSAAPMKHPRDGALAGCHPSCQAHEDHAARIAWVSLADNSENQAR